MGLNLQHGRAQVLGRPAVLGCKSCPASCAKTPKSCPHPVLLSRALPGRGAAASALLWQGGTSATSTPLGRRRMRQLLGPFCVRGGVHVLSQGLRSEPGPVGAAGALPASDKALHDAAPLMRPEEEAGEVC